MIWYSFPQYWPLLRGIDWVLAHSSSGECTGHRWTPHKAPGLRFFKAEQTYPLSRCFLHLGWYIIIIEPFTPTTQRNWLRGTTTGHLTRSYINHRKANHFALSVARRHEQMIVLEIGTCWYIAVLVTIGKYVVIHTYYIIAFVRINGHSNAAGCWDSLNEQKYILISHIEYHYHWWSSDTMSNGTLLLIW